MLTKTAPKWQDTLELVEALKNGFEATTRYYRTKQDTLRAPGLEVISNIIIEAIFSNLHQEIIQKFKDNVNFDWEHQRRLRQKWLKLYQKMPVNYFQSSAKQTVESLPFDKYLGENTFYENEKGFYLFSYSKALNKTTPLAMITYSNHPGLSCLRFYH